jgi:hypothetical protein
VRVRGSPPGLGLEGDARALVVPQGPEVAEPACEAPVASECEAETVQGRAREAGGA